MEVLTGKLIMQGYVRCSTCKEVVHKNQIRSVGHQCKDCQSLNDKARNNSYLGKARLLFQSMITRSAKRGHAKVDFTFEDFRTWLLENEYPHYYNDWVDSKYTKDLSPSVDRLSNDLGYTFDNMQLITWVENKRWSYEQNS